MITAVLVKTVTLLFWQHLCQCSSKFRNPWKNHTRTYK